MNAIAAVSADWSIGKDGGLLFHIPEDMKRFRAMTAGGTVVMGRRTLEALPGGRALPGRRNIVLTRNPRFVREGVERACSIQEALALVSGDDPDRVWLIGGGEIYEALLPFCHICYLTRVYARPDCDVYFPNLDTLADWRLLRSGAIISDGEQDFQFVEYINEKQR